ncbi:MAG: chorismate-binding protein, partial [bacterium]|nr:chorismate-binding protein [bacterium]
MKIYPLFKELYLDYETPISLFLKLTDNNTRKGFLLESKEKVETIGRYSFIGVFSNKVFSFNSDPFDKLKSILCSVDFENKEMNIPFAGGLIGYFSYDTIRYIEKLELKNPDTIRIPESLFILPEIYFVYDHFLNKSHLFTLVNTSGKDDDFSYSLETGRNILKYYESKLNSVIQMKELRITPSQEKISLTSNFSREDFTKAVEKAKEYIRNGDIFQTVLSQRLQHSTTNCGFNIYRNLRTINPSPYMYYFNLNDFEIIGASPEILVKKSKDTAILKPIA